MKKLIVFILMTALILSCTLMNVSAASLQDQQTNSVISNMDWPEFVTEEEKV